MVKLKTGGLYQFKNDSNIYVVVAAGFDTVLSRN